MPSGFAPSDCFYGAPRKEQDYLNQCTNAPCKLFDDCAHGLCDAGALDAALIAPPPPKPASPSDAGARDAGPELPSCADPNAGRGNVIYITGSSNFPPVMGKLAPLIIDTDFQGTKFTPVFLITSSCNGVKTVLSPEPADHMMRDPAPGSIASPAQYYPADHGPPVRCSLGSDGVSVDIGESDIFASSCSGFGEPVAGIGEYLGPIQAMVFVVPGNSREKTITAEAARAVFGRGGENAPKPWQNPSLYFVRNANTATQQLIGRAIDVPATAFWGIDRGTAANVDALMRAIAEDGPAQQAIGIISNDFYDSDRDNLNALAFRAMGQECAYLPDSTEFKKDKQNVRDGHYPIWGPVHFFTATNNGVPVSAAAAAFVNAVSVNKPTQPLLDAFIGSSLVPSCAMRVTRTTELGALSPYAPQPQCGCYFEASPSVNGAPPPGCSKCATGNDCPPARPACNYGYCEMR